MGGKFSICFGRNRDGSYLPPSAQIRTFGSTVYGLYLGFVLQRDHQDKNVYFWVVVTTVLTI